MSELKREGKWFNEKFSKKRYNYATLTALNNKICDSAGLALS